MSNNEVQENSEEQDESQYKKLKKIGEGFRIVSMSMKSKRLIVLTDNN